MNLNYIQLVFYMYEEGEDVLYESIELSFWFRKVSNKCFSFKFGILEELIEDKKNQKEL